MSTGGTVLDDGEDVTSPRASTALRPLIAVAYHSRYAADPELRERLAQLEARGATGIIFGTSGYDVKRELRAYAEVAGLR